MKTRLKFKNIFADQIGKKLVKLLFNQQLKMHICNHSTEEKQCYSADASCKTLHTAWDEDY